METNNKEYPNGKAPFSRAGSVLKRAALDLMRADRNSGRLTDTQFFTLAAAGVVPEMGGIKELSSPLSD